MEPAPLIGSILAIHMLAWLTPGPLFILIVRNTLLSSHRSGIWTAVGISAGNFILIACSIIGIRLAVAISDFSVDILRFLGAAYLAYLGIRTITRGSSTLPRGNGGRKLSPSAAIWTGFATSVLSPKALLFFFSIFTAVIASNSPSWVVVSLWILLPLNSFIMSTLLSKFFARKQLKNLYGKHTQIFNRDLGIALILFAMLIILIE